MGALFDQKLINWVFSVKFMNAFSHLFSWIWFRIELKFSEVGYLMYILIQRNILKEAVFST